MKFIVCKMYRLKYHYPNTYPFYMLIIASTHSRYKEETEFDFGAHAVCSIEGFTITYVPTEVYWEDIKDKHESIHK